MKKSWVGRVRACGIVFVMMSCLHINVWSVYGVIDEIVRDVVFFSLQLCIFCACG